MKLSEESDSGLFSFSNLFLSYKTISLCTTCNMSTHFYYFKYIKKKITWNISTTVAIFDFYQQEYNLALWQCYSRYLKFFGDVNVEEITDVDEFKRVFFPDGFDSEDAGFTVSVYIHVINRSHLCGLNRLVVSKLHCQISQIKSLVLNLLDNRFTSAKGIAVFIHILKLVSSVRIFIVFLIIPLNQLHWFFRVNINLVYKCITLLYIEV